MDHGGDDMEVDVEEYRQDPWNYKYYTYNEFYGYYGRDLEWELQEPNKVLRRENINDMIFRYRKYLDQNNINHLLDKIIETFI